jgi:hypothetical protein
MKMNGQVERNAFRRMEADLVNNDNEPWSTSGQCAGKMTWRINWIHPSPPPDRVFVVKTGVAIASNNSGILNPGVNGQVVVHPIEDGIVLAAFNKATLNVKNGEASTTISGSSGVKGPVPASTSFFAKWGSSVVVGHRPVTLPYESQGLPGFGRRSPERRDLVTALKSIPASQEIAIGGRSAQNDGSAEAEADGTIWPAHRFISTASDPHMAGAGQNVFQESLAELDIPSPRGRTHFFSPWQVHTDHGYSFCLNLKRGQRSSMTVDIIHPKPTPSNGSRATARRLLAFSLRSGPTWGRLLMGKKVSRMSLLKSAGPAETGTQLWTSFASTGYPKRELQAPSQSPGSSPASDRQSTSEYEGLFTTFTVGPFKLKAR